MANKGPPFEREVCKLLSLWWTKGENDAVFWRTSTSGARATSRRKKGADTPGQHGDVCATDPSGQPFCRVFSCEIKNGYSRFSPFDVVDKSKSMSLQMWEKWITQAEQSRKANGSVSWMIISHRIRRVSMVTIPVSAISCLGDDTRKGILLHLTCLRLSFIMKKEQQRLLILPLDDFLLLLSPDDVKEILNNAERALPKIATDATAREVSVKCSNQRRKIDGGR